MVVWNLDSFGLPKSRLGNFNGQTCAPLDFLAKQVGVGVKSGVSDLATIEGTDGEVPVT